VKDTLRIELDIPLNLWSEIVADDKARDPAVGPIVDELITDLVVHVDRAKLFRKFEGLQEGLARWCDSAAYGIVGIIQKELRKHGN
jgi:hypothetical protein